MRMVREIERIIKAIQRRQNYYRAGVYVVHVVGATIYVAIEKLTAEELRLLAEAKKRGIIT